MSSIYSAWEDPEQYAPHHLRATWRPQFYLNLVDVTNLVVSTIEKYASKDMSIIELGCGTGRNLVGLYKAGFYNLAGVEISQKSVDLGRDYFPEYGDIPVTVSPIEEVIEELPEYDVIYTQGLFLHLPVSNEWVITEAARRARHLLLLIEGEGANTGYSWQHNYVKIVEAAGPWKQVDDETCEMYPPLPKHTHKRVFLREDSHL